MYKPCMCLSVRLSVCKFTDVYMKVPRLIFSLSPPQAQGGTEMHRRGGTSDDPH